MVAVPYKVVDAPWFANDPASVEAMLNGLGASGWSLRATYPDSRREKTRWVFDQSSGAAAPIFPPQVSGTNATIAADFVGNQYWAAGASQASFAAWLTAIGGTFSRASTATYIDGGVVKTAAANVPRIGSNGLRLTGPQTELCLWNRDLTNAVWTKANVTAALNQAGADGVANSACSLTATAANGTALQSITRASSARIMGAYVKRITGAGTINITQDGGATWTAIVLTASWVFYALSCATLANPVVGFRIVTSGDAIAVDYVSEQEATFLADVIPTTAATVTQAADALTFPFTQTTFSALVGANSLDYDGTGQQRIIDHDSEATIYIPDNAHFATYAVSGVTGPAVTSLLNPHKTMVTGNAVNTWITSDGLVPNTVATAIVSSAPTGIYLGSQTGTIRYTNGNYTQLALWNNLVASAAEMQRLTS